MAVLGSGVASKADGMLEQMSGSLTLQGVTPTGENVKMVLRHENFALVRGMMVSMSGSWEVSGDHLALVVDAALVAESGFFGRAEGGCRALLDGSALVGMKFVLVGDDLALRGASLFQTLSLMIALKVAISFSTWSPMVWVSPGASYSLFWKRKKEAFRRGQIYCMHESMRSESTEEDLSDLPGAC